MRTSPPVVLFGCLLWAAAGSPLRLFMNVEEVCPETENVFVNGGSVPVCGATSTLLGGGKTCGKLFGDTLVQCYIPACFKGTAPPAGVKECAVSMLARAQQNQNGNGVGSAAAVPPTTVKDSFSVRGLTNLPNNQGKREGWPDIPNSAFLHFPKSLVGRIGQVPNVYLDGTFKMLMDCAQGGMGNKCDLFAFIYRCPPCTFSNGKNFVGDLLADGWEPYSCDVQFQLDQTVPTHKHDTIVYHKQIPKHGVRETGYTIAPQGILELAWFATSEATAHCKDYNEAQCNTILPDECKWDMEAQTCNRVLCPVRSQGPDRVHLPGPGGPHKPKGPWVQKCKVCVDEERDMYMPKLI
eukprot:TRINITY_DN183_c0_g1_i3.p1 TRINITY_DN183_c0_g1~~TRINITY_DN183_c0_g1_i3.p1  ORF type:complete len:352 (+),score=129.88 TRINITY_DN183_c0_g1_i3:93-1148(+)